MYTICFIFINQDEIPTKTSPLHSNTSSLLYDVFGQAVSVQGDHCKYPSLVKIGQNPAKYTRITKQILFIYLTKLR